jgi:hypothetical protein
MQVGQKVICIDDNFPKPVAKLYAELPKEGTTYTIRAVYAARAIAHPLPGADGGAELGILLQEIHNPSDPRHAGGSELGFKSDRFVGEDRLSEVEGDVNQSERTI